MEILSDSNIWLIAGILLIIMVLMRQMGLRQQKNALKQREREATLRVAQEAERKNKSQIQTAAQQKSRVIPPQTRIPLGDPLGTPFTGAIQGKAAKWEAEIHALGQQIIGQIDAKMAALQAITLDANRTANRLEILVEHLEQLARQQSQIAQNAEAESATQEPDTVIPAHSASEAAPLAEVLKELADDLEGIHKTIKKSTTFMEQPEPATILRLAELQMGTPAVASSSNPHGEVEMLANYGLEPQEIARRLNISLGEVDLVMQIQQNRREQTL